MKILNTFTAILFCLVIKAQFIEIGLPNSAYNNMAVTLVGKDYNGNLYGSSPQGFFKKANSFESPWELIHSSSNGFITQAISEIQGYKMFNMDFNNLYSSDDGINWFLVDLPSENSLITFVKYLDNDHLIVGKTDETFISTNGGFSFEQFYDGRVLSIAWDYVNNRYVYATDDGLYAKSSTNDTEITLHFGGLHQVPSIEYNNYFMAINTNGNIFLTEFAPFPFVKKFDVSNDSVTNIYPAGTSFPIHARGLFATQTGRVYCVGWSNAGLYLIEDELENYYSSVAQGALDFHFLDKAGFLYLTRNNGQVAKSNYSVRQPVFFKPISELVNQNYSSQRGHIVRASNDNLVSIDEWGKVFSSTDDGQTWDLIANIADSVGNFQNRFLYAHPNGKLLIGNFNNTRVYESNDSGITWQFNSVLSYNYNGGRFRDAAYKVDGNFSFFIKDDAILRSQNDGDTIEVMAEMIINTPNVGQVRGYNCIEITDLGTVLIGGYINTGYVYRSTDNLDSIDIIQPLGVTQQSINDIKQDENGRIWMATYSGLLYSDDDGLTWERNSDYPELTALEIVETNTGKIIVGGVNNTYLIENNQFTKINYGYNRGFKTLWVDEKTGLIFSEGFYKSAFQEPFFYTSIENSFEDMYSKSEPQVNLFPNPFVESFSISCEKCNIENVSIYNQIGQMVISKPITNSLKNLIVNTIELQKGIFFVVIKVDGAFVTKKIIKN